MSENGKKSPMVWLGLVFLGGMIGLIVLEGFSRFYYLFQNSSTTIQLSSDPQLVFEPKSNQRYKNRFHHEVRTNAAGLKGPGGQTKGTGTHFTPWIGSTRR